MAWFTYVLGALVVTFVLLAVIFRNRLSLRNKIIVLGLMIGLGSVLSVGYIATTQSSAALQDYEALTLSAIRDSRQAQIEDYFVTIHEQLVNFSQNEMVIDATRDFSASFYKVAEQSNVPTDDTSQALSEVQRYYDSQFKPRATDAGIDYRGASVYTPKDPNARVLQAWYIANFENTSFDVGDKLSLDRAKQDVDYNHHHGQYHPQIRRFLYSFGYYDIFLFDTKGNLVYSVYKETDYATNLLTGPYSSTNFGSAVKRALDGSQPGQVFVEDFKPYEPSYGSPASFISAPVFDAGKMIGCAVFQMPVDKINGIMQQAAGLGETGQTYLIAKDQRMRSNSRFSEDGATTIFNQEVDSDAVKAAFQGEVGEVKTIDYQGVEVLSAYTPLTFRDASGQEVQALEQGLPWAIVAEQSIEELTASERALARTIAFAGGGVALLVVIGSMLFAMTLIRPIRVLINRLRDMAEGEGDLTKRIDQDRKDELGEVGLWFNQFVGNVESLIIELGGVSDSVAAASTEIAASSEEMATGMSNQSEQIAEITQSIDEMSSSVVEVARKSADAANAATQAGQTAEDGGQVVRDTIEGMKGIDKAVTASSESVQELGQLGKRIGEVIAVINDIADQTNLLALNAAIEAARAGEHGRGFAVVADEVRKLADRTTKATEEIGGSITAIQTGTAAAVERMEGGTAQVKAGVERATVAGDNLEQIVASAREVSSMVQTIATASEEQSAASERVSRGAEQIAAVSRQAGKGAGQAAEAASDLSNKAEQMRALVNRFKVSG